jgi:Ran GTPase-activating protein (RanGAP) involved in mRNA processing and transport
MQLTVDNFLKLNTQKCSELIDLSFGDEDIGSDLDFSLLTDEEFIRLCDLLRFCQQLSSLELCENNLGNLSLEKIERLANCIGSCRNLQMLDLSGNNLHMLDLGSLTILAKCLSTSINLNTIILNSNKLGSLGEAKLEVLFGNLNVINLTELSLAWNKLGSNNSLKIINSKVVNYPRIKKLNLSNNKLSNNYQELVILFANLNQITSLNLSGNNLGVINEKVNYLFNDHNLEVLDLSNNKLGNSLEVFNFMMQQSRSIKELDLSCNQLNLVANLNLSGCNFLEILKLSDNDFSLMKPENFNNLIRYLATSHTLKELELDNTNLQSLMDYDLNNLFDGLIANSNLVALNINENNLSLIQSLLKLRDLLKQNKLSKLDLSCTSLGYLDLNNYQYLLDGLAASSNLKVLNISYNDLQILDLELFSKLAQVLKNCCNLEKLNLGDQDLAIDLNTKLPLLFNTLAKMPNLTKLNVSCGWTGYLGTDSKTLSNLLQISTSLKRLKLDYGYLDEEQQTKINQLLSAKPSIKLKFN